MTQTINFVLAICGFIIFSFLVSEFIFKPWGKKHPDSLKVFTRFTTLSFLFRLFK